MRDKIIDVCLRASVGPKPGLEQGSRSCIKPIDSLSPQEDMHSEVLAAQQATVCFNESTEIAPSHCGLLPWRPLQASNLR